jgi:hypothetical protein
VKLSVTSLFADFDLDHFNRIEAGFFVGLLVDPVGHVIGNVLRDLRTLPVIRTVRGEMALVARNSAPVRALGSARTGCTCTQADNGNDNRNGECEFFLDGSHFLIL